MYIKSNSIVVVLKDDSLYNNWENYCLEQKIGSDEKIIPVINPDGSTNYGCSGKEYGYCHMVVEDEWRYATIEEVEKYRKSGPYKVKPQIKSSSYYEIF